MFLVLNWKGKCDQLILIMCFNVLQDSEIYPRHLILFMYLWLFWADQDNQPIFVGEFLCFVSPFDLGGGNCSSRSLVLMLSPK